MSPGERVIAVDRVFDYKQYVAENHKRFQGAWMGWQADTQSPLPVRTRPRDPHEIALLDKLAHDNWNRALQNGTLKQVGPRRYRLHVHGL